MKNCYGDTIIVENHRYYVTYAYHLFTDEPKYIVTERGFKTWEEAREYQKQNYDCEATSVILLYLKGWWIEELDEDLGITTWRRIYK